ncbi:MAG TPA: tRNA (guanosine(37)-N1)-methyltransferase TrmD [Thermoanaerobacterales bacterium]|nr:tRNA (guanosine(37)-N1)-methyltransferase TrmD [Thermoanaerobacterales bacterium]
MLIVDVLTIFPDMFIGPFNESIIKKGQEKGLLKINITDIRDFSVDKHKKVDDYPYGGGPGMVMKPEPVFNAVESIIVKYEDIKPSERYVILMTPQGELFNQERAMELSRKRHLIVICGHYEGVDERIRQFLVDKEISIGDYVLTGGEIPAMVLIDCVARLVPGVLGEASSIEEESFSHGRLEYPHYTRPEIYKGYKVPEVLHSGNHKLISEWRSFESIKRTIIKRPDLLSSYPLSDIEQDLISRLEFNTTKDKKS